MYLCISKKELDGGQRKLNTQRMDKNQRKKKFIELIETINALNKGISQKPILTYEETDSSIYVFGVTDLLLNMHLMFIHRVHNVCFYQTNRKGKICLEAYFIA